MICEKCGKEIQNGSQFCIYCKSRQWQSESGLEAAEKPSSKKESFRSGRLTAVALAVVFVCFLNFSDAMTGVRSMLSAGNIRNSMEVYAENRNEQRVRKVQAEFERKLEQILESYNHEEIDFETAGKALEQALMSIEDDSVSENAIITLNRLNISKIAFQDGEAARMDQNFESAIQCYRRVVAEDRNYQKAMDYLMYIEPAFKEEVLEEISKETEASLVEKLANYGLTILPNDPDFTEIKRLVQEQVEKNQVTAEIASAKAEMEKLEGQQELAVTMTYLESAEISDQYYLFVMVNNQTDKLVISYTLGILTHDSMGEPANPVDSPTNLTQCLASEEVQPNASAGENYYWTIISPDIQNAMACIEEVEYSDGSKWHNPYYSYWVMAYQDKPLT